MQKTESENTPLVRLEHIYKKFNPHSVNETVLFEDFNFDIKQGEFISVVGSNGSGKTTLLNLICGTIHPDHGNIYLRNTLINKIPEYKRAAYIGRVFQDPAKGTCPSLSILENMALADNKGHAYDLGTGVSRKRIDYYKEQLELLHLGLEDKIQMPVGMLSGGQRQALAMLISTMTPIDLLVLDEHTAALDPTSSENIMHLTDQVIKEKHLSAIMVTHNLRFAAEYGNRLVMMNGGACVIDVAGEAKKAYKIENLLKEFEMISIELGN